ncbi:60S ribosomal protein L18a-like protein [Syzygium oleosum]|uniref:60S ribosomal protein L18a-like protein n=1 Tax=Syzygium oleosum TaxID=219896 RepID=UPI0024B9776A|nr:60S ribosomal protein L18a-like protein [Syzygium oleosum]
MCCFRGILLFAMEDRLDRQSDKATLMGQDEQHGRGNEKRVQILTDDGDFSLLEPASKGFSQRPFDRPLPCCGCGVGWFSFLLGFVFPPFWYYATVLYFGNYHLKDPRERAGLAASAIAALISTVAILISLLAVFFPRTFQRH